MVPPIASAAGMFSATPMNAMVSAVFSSVLHAAAPEPPVPPPLVPPVPPVPSSFGASSPHARTENEHARARPILRRLDMIARCSLERQRFAGERLRTLCGGRLPAARPTRRHDDEEIRLANVEPRHREHAVLAHERLVAD